MRAMKSGGLRRCLSALCAGWECSSELEAGRGHGIPGNACMVCILTRACDVVST